MYGKIIDEELKKNKNELPPWKKNLEASNHDLSERTLVNTSNLYVDTAKQGLTQAQKTAFRYLRPPRLNLQRTFSSKAIGPKAIRKYSVPLTAPAVPSHNPNIAKNKEEPPICKSNSGCGIFPGVLRVPRPKSDTLKYRRAMQQTNSISGENSERLISKYLTENRLQEKGKPGPKLASAEPPSERRQPPSSGNCHPPPVPFGQTPSHPRTEIRPPFVIQPVGPMRRPAFLGQMQR